VNVVADRRNLVCLVQALAWMSGHKHWSSAVIAEHLRGFDDPTILMDVDEAVSAGLVLQDPRGCRLTEAGWLLAATAAT
jgi:hypothetical protein